MLKKNGFNIMFFAFITILIPIISFRNTPSGISSGVYATIHFLQKGKMRVLSAISG